jgi:hypothetical protein
VKPSVNKLLSFDLSFLTTALILRTVSTCPHSGHAREVRADFFFGGAGGGTAFFFSGVSGGVVFDLGAGHRSISSSHKGHGKDLP